jgi:hypothetical protein
MRKSTALLVLSLAAWLPAQAASALTVTLNDFSTSYLRTIANDRSGEYALETVNPTELPHLSSSTSVDGEISSESTYTFDTRILNPKRRPRFEPRFRIDFDHYRSSENQSYAQSLGSIFFRVDEEARYRLGGRYDVVDSTGRRVSFHAVLYDYTTAEYLLRSTQESQATPNESFVLNSGLFGLAGGDTYNDYAGLPGGTLIPGHDYLFHYNVFIRAHPSTNSDATGSGRVVLNLRWPAPVPAMGPLGTALLCSLLGIAGLRRLRGNQRGR